MKEALPLLNHSLDAPIAFSLEALVEAVRPDRHLEPEPIPQICVLEPSGGNRSRFVTDLELGL
jgi:hypothetical protein